MKKRFIIVPIAILATLGISSSVVFANNSVSKGYVEERTEVFVNDSNNGVLEDTTEPTSTPEPDIKFTIPGQIFVYQGDALTEEVLKLPSDIHLVDAPYVCENTGSYDIQILVVNDNGEYGRLYYNVLVYKRPSTTPTLVPTPTVTPTSATPTVSPTNTPTATTNPTKTPSTSEPTEDVPKAEGKPVHSGSYKKTTWKIYKNGLLEVKGKGDIYSIKRDSDNAILPPWYKYRYEIKSAKVEVKGATSLIGFFNGCENLRNVDLSKLDTSKVTAMWSMFADCKSLESLDLSNFNTSKVTSMSGMFYCCWSLKSLNLSKFNTSKVTNMVYMFDGCKSIKSLNLSKFDTSKVTDMYYMFSGCKKLVKIRTPKKSAKKVPTLPKGTWKSSSGKKYKTLPKNAKKSITLTKK